MNPPSTPRKVEALVPRDRLESWKEIAAYLSRSERTVRRWEEKEGLPVHRLAHDKRGSVYGYAWELDAWRESRRQLVDAEQAETASEDEPRQSRRPVAVAIGAVLVAAAAAGVWWFTQTPATAARTPNPEAVRLVKLANFAGNAGRTQVETAIRYYQEALRLDPSYAPAWGGMAVAHFVRAWLGEAPAIEAAAQARSEAEQAIRLNPRASPPWRLLGLMSHFVDWDHQRSEVEFRKAMTLNPEDSVALSWFADTLTNQRRFDEAREQYKRSHDVAPRWLEPITFSGNTHLFQGNPALAIAEHLRVLESEPTFGFANHYLGRAYVAKGDYQKGIGYLRKSNELLGSVPFSLGDLGYSLAVAGERAEAVKMRDDLVARRSKGYYPAFPIAAIETGLGNVDSALGWLERAADERNLGFYMPSVDPSFDRLRTQPRFKAILARARLPLD